MNKEWSKLNKTFSRHWIMHVEASLRIRNKIMNKGH